MILTGEKRKKKKGNEHYVKPSECPSKAEAQEKTANMPSVMHKQRLGIIIRII